LFVPDSGRAQFERLCSANPELPISLIYAETQSAVSKKELGWMLSVMGKTRKGGAVEISKSTHSIHNTQREAFTEEIVKFINTVLI
jgi:hypothetical protein